MSVASGRTFSEVLSPGLTAKKNSGALQDITVVTYNILADKYATSGMHACCPVKFLDWAYRAPRLMEEIPSYAADILCLQEVEHPFVENVLRPELNKQGYSTIYYKRKKKRSKRNPGPPDGVCLCYRHDRLEQVAQSTVRFGDFSMAADVAATSQFASFLANREDGAVLALLRDTKTDRLLLAVSTHLFWDPNYPEIKAAQAHILCASIQRFAEEHGAATRDTIAALPVIIGGDFNSLPWKHYSDEFDAVEPGGKLVSGAYELLTQGKLHATHPHHPAMRKHNAQHASKLRNVSFNTSGMRLCSASVEAWGAEPSFTNRTSGFSGCLDYVFISEHWKVSAALDMPYAWDPQYPERSLNSVDRVFEVLPSERWPSDHLAVGVKLRLCES